VTRFAVLGSNSFTGATFVTQLVELGHDVLGFSRSPEPADAFLPYKWKRASSNGRFSFHQADLNTDLEAIIGGLESFAPACVVNFAAQSMVAESWIHPEHWYQTNVVANVRLHDRLRSLKTMERYVHVSTPEVYGSCSGTVREDAPFNPSTPYAASRAACDLHLATFFKQYAFPVVFTRAANVYGPGQQLYRIIPRTILYIRTGRRLQLHGGGTSVRSFIHGRDVADATMRVAERGISGQAYHLSTDRRVSIRELVELICSMLGAEFDEVVDVAPERPGKDVAYLLDSTRARRELGWQDRISLEDGLRETVAWVENNLDALLRQPSEYIHRP
jgi:dTDP-glucose 4,6-dehydratase